MEKQIYVASSWRNEYQQGVMRYLREYGFSVYDFRNPVEGDNGFHWSDIDPNWESWNVKRFSAALNDKLAEDGFKKDFDALKNALAVVLVLPCGRSAHLEAGYGVGRCPVFIYSPVPCEPELMYKMTDGVFDSIDDVVECLEGRADECEAK